MWVEEVLRLLNFFNNVLFLSHSSSVVAASLSIASLSVVGNDEGFGFLVPRDGDLPQVTPAPGTRSCSFPGTRACAIMDNVPTHKALKATSSYETKRAQQRRPRERQLREQPARLHCTTIRSLLPLDDLSVPELFATSSVRVPKEETSAKRTTSLSAVLASLLFFSMLIRSDGINISLVQRLEFLLRRSHDLRSKVMVSEGT